MIRTGPSRARDWPRSWDTAWRSDAASPERRGSPGHVRDGREYRLGLTMGLRAPERVDFVAATLHDGVELTARGAPELGAELVLQ